MLNSLLGCYNVYYALQLLGVWLPFLAAWIGGRRLHLRTAMKSVAAPFFYVVVPCRDAAGSVPGLVDCLRKQTYSADRFRILIIADNCRDRSAEVARSLGVEVYERTDSAIKTKSEAINEVLNRRLRQETFDALLMFDIDGRMAPDFLARAAAHWKPVPMVLQGLHQSLNASENALTRIEDAIAGMLRYRQIGRAVFGWPAYLVGGHGLMISRPALDRLDWSLCEGTHLTEDTELILRCYLRDIPLLYATDLAVANELPSTPRSIRTQRRRWGAGTIELAGAYFWPLFRRGLTGDFVAFQLILDLLIAPPLSLFWIASGVFCGLLGIVSLQHPSLAVHFKILLTLCLLHALYYAVALVVSSDVWRWSDLSALVLYLGVRARAVMESIGLSFSKGDRWVPTPHGPERRKQEETR